MKEVRVGSRVRFLGGPMQGRYGIVTAMKARRRMTVMVESAAGDQLVIESSPRWLRPVPPLN